MAKTLQQRYIAALKARGCTEFMERRKYTILRPREKDPRYTGGTFYYIGVSGSVRYGQTYTGSRPVSKMQKELLLTEAPAGDIR